MLQALHHQPRLLHVQLRHQVCLPLHGQVSREVIVEKDLDATFNSAYSIDKPESKSQV